MRSDGHECLGVKRSFENVKMKIVVERFAPKGTPLHHTIRESGFNQTEKLLSLSYSSFPCKIFRPFALGPFLI